MTHAGQRENTASVLLPLVVHLWHHRILRAHWLPVVALTRPNVHWRQHSADSRLQIPFLFFVTGLTLVLGVLFGVGRPSPARDALEIAGLQVQHQRHRRCVGVLSLVALLTEVRLTGQWRGVLALNPTGVRLVVVPVRL